MHEEPEADAPMSRVSPVAKEPPKNRKYVAKRDYGTRGYESRKKRIRFGDTTATLYKRADVKGGSWTLRFNLRAEKRSYRRSLDTSDLREAERRAHSEVIKILTRIESGQTILAPSLHDVALEFEQEQSRAVKAGELAAKTQALQRYRIKLGLTFLREKLPAGDQTKVSAIDGGLFEGYLPWRKELRATKVKDGTIRRDVVRDELLTVRKMFKYAHAKRLCSENSIPRWSFPIEKESSRRRRMTQRNYADFIKCIRTWRLKAKDEKGAYHRELLRHFVLVVANTGLRTGELFGLRNKDVEVREKANECVIAIRAETSKVRKGRQITVLPSHGGRSSESEPRAVNYLIRWITTFQRHKGPEDCVFAPFDSGKKEARDIYYHCYKSLREDLKPIGLDWFDTYHCRHFWITNRLLAEEAIHLVAKAAGTSTGEIEATYSHVLTELATKRFGKKSVVYERDGSWNVVQQAPAKVKGEPHRIKG